MMEISARRTTILGSSRRAATPRRCDATHATLRDAARRCATLRDAARRCATRDATRR
jgi:hypothetical protein